MYFVKMSTPMTYHLSVLYTGCEEIIFTLLNQWKSVQKYINFS